MSAVVCLVHDKFLTDFEPLRLDSSFAYRMIGIGGRRVSFSIFKRNLAYRIWNAVRQSIQEVKNIHVFHVN